MKTLINFSLTKHLDHCSTRNSLLEHSPIGGESVFGKEYKGGEFIPFYIPRDHMPQVNEEDYSALFDFLTRKKAYVTKEMVPPKSVYPHQRVNIAALKSIMKSEDEFTQNVFLSKAVLVSGDRFIIDGHHRWDFHILRHDPFMTIYRIARPFDQALELIFEFPKTQTTNIPT